MTGPSSTIFWCRRCTEQSRECTLVTLPCLQEGQATVNLCIISIEVISIEVRWCQGLLSSAACQRCSAKVSPEQLPLTFERL